jgi:hypothetical protein
VVQVVTTAAEVLETLLRRSLEVSEEEEHLLIMVLLLLPLG